MALTKTVVISDLHGRTLWRDILHKEKPNRVIFMGDYFDGIPSPLEQIHNFKAIMALRGDVIWLIGNHDAEYMPGYTGMLNVYDAEMHQAIKQVVYEHRRKLQLCYEMGDILFSHAGVTKTFLHRVMVPDDEYVADNLNMLAKATINSFRFRDGTCQDEYGDDINQGPLWVRPRSLMLDSINRRQVVGHTRHDKLRVEFDKFYFTDTLATSREYLIITEEGDKQVISIGQLKV